MPNLISNPDPYEKLGGVALRASAIDWARQGYDGFMGFGVKFNEEGKGWDYCDDCICDDNCNELEKTEACFNLGATPVSFYATRAGEVSVDLKEDTTARSRQWERYNNPNFKPFPPEEDILEGKIKPLNIRNITQVITNGNGDFIDTDFINSGFIQGMQLVPVFNAYDEDENPVYRYDFEVGDYNLPTFDKTYNCLKYPMRVQAQYWHTEIIDYTDGNGDSQSYTRLLSKTDVIIKIVWSDNTENRTFTLKEGENLIEVFKEAIEGKCSISITIKFDEGDSLTWTSNKAKNLIVTSSNTLISKEKDGEVSASDTWEITDSYIKANLKLFTDGIATYTNSGFRQNEAIPHFAGNFDLAGEYNVHIGLENKDVFSVLARRFFINIIYSLNDAENCEPEIIVEGLGNKDGFTDDKVFKATPDDLNTYDFKLNDLTFIERNWYGENNDGVLDIQLSNNDEPLDIIRVKSVEVVANLNWLRKLENEEELKIYAKGGAFCPSTFRVIISNRIITNANEFLNNFSPNAQPSTKEIYEIYGDETLTLPNAQRVNVANILFNKDELNFNPVDLEYNL